MLNLKRRRSGSETNGSEGSCADAVSAHAQTSSPYFRTARTADAGDGSTARSPAADPNAKSGPLMLPSLGLLDQSKDDEKVASSRSHAPLDPQLTARLTLPGSEAFHSDVVSLRHETSHARSLDLPERSASTPIPDDAEEEDHQRGNSIGEQVTIEGAETPPRAPAAERRTRPLQSKPRKKLRTLKSAAEADEQEDLTWCDALEERVKEVTSHAHDKKEP